MMMGKNLEELNKEQHIFVPPWHNARFDRYTMAFATRYLVKYRPRFMFLSLNDSDDVAHTADYAGYISALQDYDTWLKQLQELLMHLGEYGKNTTIIVTTDHGRGEGEHWISHGEKESMTESKPIWLAAVGPHTTACGVLTNPHHSSKHIGASDSSHNSYNTPSGNNSSNISIKDQIHYKHKLKKKHVYTHLDIRPTIEHLLGVRHKASPFHGKILSEVIGED